MGKSLWVSVTLACFAIGAGFLFLKKDSPKDTQATVEAQAPRPDHSVRKIRIAWPTPNPRLKKIPSDEELLQPTASGNPASALYGMVREGGSRFHEGLDLRPQLPRDRKGEPTDPVSAAMDGRVAYANPRANGAYGRYVVLEHDIGNISLYTLYAHLASVEASLKEGRQVAAGEKIGVMGRSDANGGFPKERAHLHFEVGLRLSDRFSDWYRSRKFPDPNNHGNFNGVNLSGIDPEEFFKLAENHGGEPDAESLCRWVSGLSVAVAVEARSSKTPSLLKRCPALLRESGNGTAASGWRVGFTVEGVPVSWERIADAPATPKVDLVKENGGREARRRGLIVPNPKKRGAYHPGSTLETALALTLAH